MQLDLEGFKFFNENTFSLSTKGTFKHVSKELENLFSCNLKGSKFSELFEDESLEKFFTNKNKSKYEGILNFENNSYSIKMVRIKNNIFGTIEKEGDSLNKSNNKKSILEKVSQEVRTPLNAIINFSKHALKSKNIDDKNETFNLVINSSNELLTIVDTMMDVERIESGSMQLREDEVFVKELFDSVLSGYKLECESRGVAFNVTYENLDKDAFITDRTLVTQIITQLVSNSVKNTTEGSIDVLVKNNSLNLISDISFTIKDTSLGMNKSLLKSSLENSSSDDLNGLGLGLSLLKKTLDFLDGSLNVKSILGKGNEFEFVIPMLHGNASLVHSVDKNVSYNANILVVEDNFINKKVLERCLNNFDIRPEFVDNGLEAVNYLDNNSCDLIFMDCYMPVMDGFDATERIRKDNKNIPIIAMTADVSENNRSRCLNVGMDYFLEKPLNEENLIIVLDYFLENKELNNEVIKMNRHNEVENSKLFDPKLLNKFLNENLEVFNSEEHSNKSTDELEKIKQKINESNEENKEENKEFVKTILNHFYTNANKYEKDIEQALLEENRDALKKHMHAYKGSMLAIGIIKAGIYGDIIDKTCKNKDFPTLRQEYSKFKESLNLGKERLEYFLKEQEIQLDDFDLAA